MSFIVSVHKREKNDNNQQKMDFKITIFRGNKTDCPIFLLSFCDASFNAGKVFTTF